MTGQARNGNVSFLKRHPKLSLKTADPLEKYRAQITEEYIRAWFNDLEKYIEEHNSTTPNVFSTQTKLDSPYA